MKAVYLKQLLSFPNFRPIYPEKVHITLELLKFSAPHKIRKPLGLKLVLGAIDPIFCLSV